MAKEQTRKLQFLWEQIKKNENTLDTMPLQQILTSNCIFPNKPTLITVVEKLVMIDYRLMPYGIEIMIPFEKISIYNLANIHIIPLFYSESQIIDPIIYGNPPSYSIIQGTNKFYCSLVKRWQYLDGQYILRIVIQSRLQDAVTYAYLPLYLDLDILIDNTRTYINTQGYSI